MKIKKRNLMIGTAVGAIALIALVLMLLSMFAPKPFYNNVNSTRPILGNPDAKVKVVEFSDIQCPACKLASNFPQRLVNQFGSNVSVEFRHFPLTFHPDAYKSALAAECANDQGKFWEFVELAYLHQDKLSTSDLKTYAKDVGVDTSSFNACLDSEAKRDVVDGYMREGYALKIPGTPTFFINNKMSASNSYEDIAAMVQEEINKN